MRLEYHPATVADLNGAISHYNTVQEGLGDALRTEVHAAIDRIVEHPQQYAETGGVRRALVRRFPYSVLYRFAAEDCIRILVIRHHKRHPDHGMERQ